LLKNLNKYFLPKTFKKANYYKRELKKLVNTFGLYDIEENKKDRKLQFLLTFVVLITPEIETKAV
jgi:hypothetical protein